MSLYPLVNLYRKVLSSARIDENVLVAEAPYSEEIKELITQVRGDEFLGRFKDIEIDDQDFTDEVLPATSGVVSFELVLRTGGTKRFYRNFGDFISSNSSINRGEIPEEFYLIEEDCYSFDEAVDSCVSALSRFCEFVICLSKLAHYHDAKKTDDTLKLVFIHPEDGGGKRALEVEVKANEKIVNMASELDLGVLQSLSNHDQTTDVHYYEKINIFTSTLIDVVGKDAGGGRAFQKLVESWQEFLETFDKNVSTYMSGFAFHKAKREVAEAEISLSEKMSKILSDITTRVLSIPLSFAAIIVLLKADGFWEAYFIVVGVFITSVIISQLVANQQVQFKRVVHSKELTLSSFIGKQSEYPADLKSHIENMISELDRYEKKVKVTLGVFRVLSWAPITIALLIFVWVYTNWLS